MELHLKIIGILLIPLALIHIIFPRYFNWKQELPLISKINSEMMYVHAFFIAFMVLLMGILCISSAGELVGTPLGKRVCLGIGIFWAARLFTQFFGYSSVHWRGKHFETVVHVVFSIFWIYLSTVFLSIYLM